VKVHNLRSSQNIINVAKLRIALWLEHTARAHSNKPLVRQSDDHYRELGVEANDVKMNVTGTKVRKWIEFNRLRI
jgi:hypothetical protein